MTHFSNKIFIFLVIFLLFANLSIAVADDVDIDKLIGRTTVVYFTDLVMLTTFDLTNPLEEVEPIIIFPDSDALKSEMDFKIRFELGVMHLSDSDDFNFTRIKAFGVVNGDGYFGEWTPYGGYKYYYLP